MTHQRTRSFALALAAAVTSATLAGCGDGGDSAADDTGAPETTETSAPTEDPTSEEPESSAPTEESPGAATTVPVYYVGDTPQGARLFREFHAAEGDDPLDAAAELLTSGTPGDPDYRTPFPGGDGIDGVDSEEGAISVDLDDPAWAQRPPGMSGAEAKLAVQALVYTLQGAAQSRAPVTVYDDDTATSLFGVDTSAGVKAKPQLSVLGLVNVTTPEEGATVSGSFDADGVASSFEATVPWEIRQGDQVVDRGFTTAEGWIDRLYPWTAKVDVSKLEPGEYTFAAMTDDPSGGEGGGPTEDTKTIIVE